MGYRGEDLDLRTPQSLSGGAVDPAGAYEGTATKRGAYRQGPIWVDDTILTCSNHAFDLALANRAAEVRIEHLIHALTRVEVAAEALEARGVRVAQLRRESAVVVGSDLPVALANGKGYPRRSDDLAEVLRLAAANAARRDAPAGIEDLLNTLLDPRADFNGLPLLTRHVTRFVSETRFADASDPQRFRPVAHYVGDDLRPEANRGFRAEGTRGEPPILHVDQHYVSRLDMLEQLLQDISSELANERGVLAKSLDGVGKDVGLQRDQLKSADGRLGDLAQKLGNLETSLADLKTATAADAGALKETVSAFDLSPLTQKLIGLEDAFLSRAEEDQPEVVARLTSVEGEIGRLAQSASDAAGRVETIVAGIASPIVEQVEASAQSNHDALSELAARLEATERALVAQSEATLAARKAYEQELSEVHGALVKLNGNQHTLAGSIDQWRLDASGDLAIIANRLDKLDAENERPVQLIEALTTTTDNMNRLTVERYHRRNRFWYWLFGTDDWITASWPSQVASVENEMKALKDSREARASQGAVNV